MQRSRAFFLLVMITAMTTSCLKRFDPHIDSRDTVKYVITGQVTKGEQIHYINVSKTAALSDPWYEYKVPVTGCRVIIVDDKGNMYYAEDLHNGNYGAYIPDRLITPGSAFKVEVRHEYMNDGEYQEVRLVSDYDTLQECPDVDSVYYMVKQFPSVDQYHTIKGIQFYCNLNAKKYTTRNFRWEVTETWEYKAIFADLNSPQRVCWMTNKTMNIFTLSTKNLSENIYKLYPFHFVDNYSSQRLKYGYSLLIRQFSLSDKAAEYWEKIRVNNAELGGLYEKQPLIIKGNIHNLSDPDQQVLGFFGVSAMKSKRIFITKIEGLPIEYIDCTLPSPGDKLEPACGNCLLSGGTNVKPDFWPY